MLQVSSSLVKMLAGTIMTSLIAIAGYMLVWNRDDAAFKKVVTLQLNNMEGDLSEIKQTMGVVPGNTQRINDLTDRVRRLENGADEYHKGPTQRADQ